MPVRRIRCIWQIGRLGEANGATLDLKEEQENSNARHVRTPICDFSASLGRTSITGRERHRRGHAALKGLPRYERLPKRDRYSGVLLHPSLKRPLERRLGDVVISNEG